MEANCVGILGTDEYNSAAIMVLIWTRIIKLNCTQLYWGNGSQMAQGQLCSTVLVSCVSAMLKLWYWKCTDATQLY